MQAFCLSSAISARMISHAKTANSSPTRPAGPGRQPHGPGRRAGARRGSTPSGRIPTTSRGKRTSTRATRATSCESWTGCGTWGSIPTCRWPCPPGRVNWPSERFPDTRALYGDRSPARPGRARRRRARHRHGALLPHGLRRASWRIPGRRPDLRAHPGMGPRRRERQGHAQRGGGHGLPVGDVSLRGTSATQRSRSGSWDARARR